MKAQWVRIADVILLAPAMYMAGHRLRKTSPRLGVFMMLAGIATAGYNGKNYLEVESRRK